MLNSISSAKNLTEEEKGKGSIHKFFNLPPFNKMFKIDSHRVLGTIFVFLVWWIPVAWSIFLNTGLNVLGLSTTESLDNLFMQHYVAIHVVCDLVPSLFLSTEIQRFC